MVVLVPVLEVPHLALPLLLVVGQEVHLAQEVLEVDPRPAGHGVVVCVEACVGHPGVVSGENWRDTSSQHHVW